MEDVKRVQPGNTERATKTSAVISVLADYIAEQWIEGWIWENIIETQRREIVKVLMGWCAPRALTGWSFQIEEWVIELAKEMI